MTLRRPAITEAFFDKEVRLVVARTPRNVQQHSDSTSAYVHIVQCTFAYKSWTNSVAKFRKRSFRIYAEVILPGNNTALLSYSSNSGAQSCTAGESMVVTDGATPFPGAYVCGCFMLKVSEMQQFRW